MVIEMKEQYESSDKISIYDYKKEIKVDLQNLCAQLETMDTKDIEIAKVQNKIKLHREFLENLKRIE